MKTVAVSGGFDPLHIGHMRLIQEAYKFGSVHIILNSDDWLMRKKGYIFMPWEHRQEILDQFCQVIAVTAVDDLDGTVCEALRRIRPKYFANGGDRKEDNTPEAELCRNLGIEMLWNVGGEKMASSSELVEKATDYIHASDNEITGLWVQK